MDARKKNVAVVGCGPSGMMATKILREYGHEVTCYEKDSALGGLWNFTPEMQAVPYEQGRDERHGIKATYGTLVMNGSAITSCFSDFPYGPGEPTMLRHEAYLAYLQQYAERFGVEDHVQYNSQVESVRKDREKWNVTYLNRSNPESATSAQFDHVVLASGPFRYPRIPDIFGLASFEGTAIHSAQVRNEGLLLQGKRVVVVGDNFSGLDLCCAALQVGSQKVYMSMKDEPGRRHQFYCNSLYADPDQGGRRLPLDYYFVNHHYRNSDAKSVLDARLLSDIKRLRKSTPPDHVGQFPKDGLVPTPHADLLTAKWSDNVFETVAEIAEVHPHGVTLTDGTELSDIDAIVFATGYKCRFPMLDNIWPREQQEQCKLYLHCIPTEKELDGLAFLYSAVTMSQATMPLMEMQMRYLCEKVFSEGYDPDGLLFSDDQRREMRKDIEEETASNGRHNRPYHFYADVPGLLQRLSREVGCEPPDHRPLLAGGSNQRDEDLEFAVAMEYAPLVPVHYRLRGPHSWGEARSYIVRMAKDVLGVRWGSLVAQHSAV